MELLGHEFEEINKQEEGRDTFQRWRSVSSIEYEGADIKGIIDAFINDLRPLSIKGIIMESAEGATGTPLFAFHMEIHARFTERNTIRGRI